MRTKFIIVSGGFVEGAWSRFVVASGGAGGSWRAFKSLFPGVMGV
jgi:hypothetical protein